MTSLITKEMEEILSFLESTEDMYEFIIHSHKSKDFQEINICDGKVFIIKINSNLKDVKNE